MYSTYGIWDRIQQLNVQEQNVDNQINYFFKERSPEEPLSVTHTHTHITAPYKSHGYYTFVKTMVMETVQLGSCRFSVGLYPEARLGDDEIPGLIFPSFPVSY